MVDIDVLLIASLHDDCDVASVALSRISISGF